MISETEFLVRNVNDSVSKSSTFRNSLSPLEIYRTNHMAWDFVRYCCPSIVILWEKKINERKREWRKRLEWERESKENGDMRVFSRVFSTFCLECKICAINKFSLFSFSFGYFLYVHELYVWGLLLMWEWVCGFEQALKWSQRVIIVILS